MASLFSVTTTNNTVRPDAKGSVAVPFTVTNISKRPLRGRVKAVPVGAAKENWFRIEGEPERDFPADGTEQVTVRIDVPPGTPPDKYAFRLDAVSVARPDEDFTEGPVVTLVTAPDPRPAFPWAVVAIVLLILVVGGVTTWLLFPKPPPTVTVPKVTEKSEGEAVQALAALGLKADLPVKHQAVDPAVHTPGQVFEQNPPAGAVAHPGDKVTLTVADALPPKTVKLESQVGKPIEEAKTYLTNLGVPFTVLDQLANEPGISPGAVAFQSPVDGDIDPKTQKVTLKEQGVPVPDLTHKTLAGALLYINQNHIPLNLQVDPAETIADTQQLVWQSPSPSGVTRINSPVMVSGRFHITIPPGGWRVLETEAVKDRVRRMREIPHP